MPFDLNGHVAVVSGNSSGLGKAIGLALGKAGARVPINYLHDTARAESTLAEYEAAGVESLLIQADVTTQAGVRQLFDAVETTFGEVDILVPNATCRQLLKPIEQYTWESYQQMIDYFVKSPFLLTQRALPSMKAKSWGRIISITSEVFHRSVSPLSGYAAAKGGQIGWSRSMARELAPTGITVNMIAPGWIPADPHAQEPRSLMDEYFTLIPARRWGLPEDVAGAVLYLASDEASFVTGQTLCVNGGLTPW